MKKALAMLIIGMTCTLLLAGCNEKKEPGASQDSVEETKTRDSVADQNKTVTKDMWLKDIAVEDYVSLGEYKNLTLSVNPVTEEEIEESMQSFYTGLYPSDMGVKDKAVEMGDTANIDYEGKKDGVAFEGGTAQGYSLTIGSGQFIPGFEEGLVGVMPGETVDLPLTFPEQYHSADLAGQEVVFTVTVNYVIPGEMDDEVIAVIMQQYGSDIKDKAGLRQYIVDYLNEYYNQELGNAAFSSVMASSTFEELPEALIERFKENTRISLTQAASGANMAPEDYVAVYYGQEYESFVTDYAIQSLQMNLVSHAIAKKEGISVSDEQLDTKLKEAAAGVGVTVDELIGEVDKEEYRQFFIYEAVLQFLIENNVQ